MNHHRPEGRENVVGNFKRAKLTLKLMKKKGNVLVIKQNSKRNFDAK
jgi:hypothetical protein